MTQEEKAKRYDDVVSKLGRFMTQGVDPLITRADVQDFFPELKESEDEMIRKELIQYLKDYPNLPNGNYCRDDFFAYLEKQDEQKQDPRYSIVEDLLAADDIFQMSVNESMVKKAEAMALNAVQKLEVSKLLGLGKPEWSEEDEKMVKCCEIALEFFEKLGKNTQGFPHENYFELDEKIYPSEVNPWLKSLKERYTWKPSDEQKPVLPGFEQQEGVAGRDYIPVDWVQTIENYGKWKIVRVNEQKPVWSEKDDINLGKAIWYVENPAPMVVKDSMLVEWLKALKERCTWKPSDEQMEVLQESIGIVGQLTPRGECLKELAEQLKKLKGE